MVSFSNTNLVLVAFSDSIPRLKELGLTKLLDEVLSRPLTTWGGKLSLTLDLPLPIILSIGVASFVIDRSEKPVPDHKGPNDSTREGCKGPGVGDASPQQKELAPCPESEDSARVDKQGRHDASSAHNWSLSFLITPRLKHSLVVPTGRSEEPIVQWDGGWSRSVWCVPVCNFYRPPSLTRTDNCRKGGIESVSSRSTQLPVPSDTNRRRRFKFNPSSPGLWKQGRRRQGRGSLS